MNTVWRASKLFQQAMDVIYPPRCAGCQSSGHVLCPACLARIQPLSGALCQRCSRPLSFAGSCPDCLRKPPNVTGLRVASIYQDPLRSCIHAFKYEGNTRLAEPLGKLLAQVYERVGIKADTLVPVPLHSERHEQRGYNHAALLAQVCASHTGIPYHEHLLFRQRATRAQVDLKPWERQQNMVDAIICHPAYSAGQLRGRTIVIIDDVCTTGATLEACAAPLFAAGARAVWGLALARPFSSP